MRKIRKTLENINNPEQHKKKLKAEYKQTIRLIILTGNFLN
jgi:mRNA-degrading endonuclease RelE of RelBE toxin-antitoxin system